MSVRGTIAVDVAFTDGTSSAAGSSLNTITLRDATEYTTGKVAIVSGTVGTAAVTVSTAGAGLGYRNAAGQLVTFSDVRRVLFAWNGSAVGTLRETGDNAFLMTARAGEPASTSLPLYPGVQMEVSSGSEGVTATYSIVIYGT
jgi:hypothetical protein